MTRIVFCAVFVLLLDLPLSAQTIQNSLADEEQTGSKELSPFARELLAADEADLKRLSLDASQGLIELAPVNLPTNPKGDNDHFGWPVATMLDDTLIVVHRAMPGHNRKLSGDADTDTTYSTIVRSTDGGQTWSEPYAVRQCMTEEDRNRGGSVPLSHRYKFDPDNHSPLGYKLHLNAIGTTRDGAVILVSDHGVFRSEDKGRTWKHLREAFREDHHDGPFVSVGPRIIDHPEHGLLLFAHHTVYENHRPHDSVGRWWSCHSHQLTPHETARKTSRPAVGRGFARIGMDIGAEKGDSHVTATNSGKDRMSFCKLFL